MSATLLDLASESTRWSGQQFVNTAAANGRTVAVRQLDEMTDDEWWQILGWMMERHSTMLRDAIELHTDHSWLDATNSAATARRALREHIPPVPEPERQQSIENLRWLCNLPLIAALRTRIENSTRPFPTATFSRWLAGIDHSPLPGYLSFEIDLMDVCMEEDLWPGVLTCLRNVLSEINEYQTSVLGRLASDDHFGHINALLAAGALDAC